jgi:hypothetical protein
VRWIRFSGGQASPCRRLRFKSGTVRWMRTPGSGVGAPQSVVPHGPSPALVSTSASGLAVRAEHRENPRNEPPGHQHVGSVDLRAMRIMRAFTPKESVWLGLGTPLVNNRRTSNGLASGDDLRVRLDARATEELQVILQELNTDEWRPEVFPIVESILRGRGAGLMSQQPGLAENRGVDSPRVELGPVMSELDGRTWLSVLESAGIPAWATEAPLNTTHGLAVGIQLCVRPEDEEEANEALSAYSDAKPILPGDIATPSCPRCGSSKTTQDSEVEEIPDVLLETRRGRWSWHFDCEGCGHRWLDEGG